MLILWKRKWGGRHRTKIPWKFLFLPIFHKSHNLEIFYSSPREIWFVSKFLRSKSWLKFHHDNMFLFLLLLSPSFLHPWKTRSLLFHFFFYQEKIHYNMRKVHMGRGGRECLLRTAQPNQYNTKGKPSKSWNGQKPSPIISWRKGQEKGSHRWFFFLVVAEQTLIATRR